MNSLNSVLLEGNLTDKPEEIRNGVCGFTVESTRKWINGDTLEKEVSLINIETFGDLGKRCFDELTKGRGVRVVGRLKQEIDDIEGIAYSKIWIVAEHVEFKPVIEVPPEVEYAEQFKNFGLTPS